MKHLIYVIAAIILTTGVVEGDTINVPGDYPTIQEGITAAEDGDTVLLADGTYTGPGNFNIDFQGKAIEVTSSGGAEKCILTDSEHDPVFVFSNREGPDSFLVNLTIQNAYSAVNALDASPTIVGCIFENNRKRAITTSGQPLIQNCQFIGNHSKTGGAISDGGIIDNCIFTNNTASFAGGALYLARDSEVTHCVFIGNEASCGGAVHCEFNMNFKIGGTNETGNIFTHNYAAVGADLSAGDSVTRQIDARGNVFSGFQSDYYFSPGALFDLTSCQFNGSPVQADLFIAEDGNDANDGLGWDSPLKTVRAAMSRLSTDETHPLTVHIGPGTFSSDITGESFPIPLLSNVSIVGSGSELTILDARGASHVIRSLKDHNVSLTNLSLKGASDSGLHASNSSLTLDKCIIRENLSNYHGGGILCHESDMVLNHCDFLYNDAVWPGGGGIACNDGSDVTINACRFTANQAIQGAGVLCWSNDAFNPPTVTIDGSVFNSNNATSTGSAIQASYGRPVISDSQFYDNDASAIEASVNGSVTLEACIITHNHVGVQARGTISRCMISHNDDLGVLMYNANSHDGENRVVSTTISDNGEMGLKMSTGRIEDCLITRNRNGGIYASNSSLLIQSCVISDNTAMACGGGIRCQGCEINAKNCLIANNQASCGGGISLSGSIDALDKRFENCTIVDNQADHGTGFHLNTCQVTIANSILWNPDGDEFDLTSSVAQVTHSCIHNGFEGQGNIHGDPLFTSGVYSDYHLSQRAAGHTANSPCVDSGSDAAINICMDTVTGDICMSDLWTGTDTIPDSDTVDMGVHYPVTTVGFPLVKIAMPASEFHSGDTCSCDVTVTNYSSAPIDNEPLFVLLDVLGTLYFAPAFSSFDYYYLSYPVGQTTVNILSDFIWPEETGTFSGVYWYSAMTNTDFSVLTSNLAIFEFGWSE